MPIGDLDQADRNLEKNRTLPFRSFTSHCCSALLNSMSPARLISNRQEFVTQLRSTNTGPCGLVRNVITVSIKVLVQI